MKQKKVYVCTSCGSVYPKWSGKCSECGEWNTIEESVSASQKSTAGVGKSHAIKFVASQKAVKVNEIQAKDDDRIVTGIGEFDRVMGGGIVPDSITMLASPAGGGKSSLLGSVLTKLARRGYRVLYASGEESETQIKNRLTRIEGEVPDNFWLISSNCLDDVLGNVLEIDADIIVIDSIQTMYLNEFLPARQGNPTQSLNCMDALMAIAKNPTRKRAILVISQLNKKEEMAGLQALSHAVDTVTYLQAENNEELRALVASKNRFGSVGEMGFFKMTERGLISVDNPSEYYTVQRAAGEEVSGSALAVIREGTRPIVLEVQSLVSTSYTSFPTRITDSFSRDALNTLVSVLEQRALINLSDKNVVVKAMGTGKLKDPAANLAVCMSIASGLSDKPIPNTVAFIGDIGLTGEIKKVPATEFRVKELARMGFKKVYVAAGSIPKGVTFEGLTVIQKRTLKEVIFDAIGTFKKGKNEDRQERKDLFI